METNQILNTASLNYLMMASVTSWSSPDDCHLNHVKVLTATRAGLCFCEKELNETYF